MKRSTVGLLLITLPFLQGCGIGILAAGVGYAVGQGRKGTAAQMEAKSKYTALYNDYKLGMEKINLEREKSNLPPQPIMDFDEWLNLQPLTPEERKIFAKYKVQTPKEIKEQEKTKSETLPATTEVKPEPTNVTP